MAALRTGVGLSAVLAPTLLSRVSGLPTPLDTASTLVMRLFGIRDALLAAALWVTMRDESKSLSVSALGETRRSVRRVLSGGVVVDLVDAVSVFATVAGHGMLTSQAVGVFGGGAVLYMGLGAAGLNAYRV
ncbi:hypothetical protein N7474_008589 [Penicillium riverlandense]|uniref:uncharacterized protein n=1 Tax=Penicillium riverlandense TaxID=1903569 RepID=UPI0025488B4D|nr:uncharacterized protein N7474_008589 [Penicillium riverlandense]KAJ5812288.1 hypothetical protein N7474_008589 [Penicillium riverlandense]